MAKAKTTSPEAKPNIKVKATISRSRLEKNSILFNLMYKL